MIRVLRASTPLAVTLAAAMAVPAGPAGPAARNATCRPGLRLA